ncbi:MAG TPA: hypothetical protein VLD62_00195, partial [Acidimicrobiia bacterium]|nr:hypothetical protein [Acidimicrobiia bacterium]
MPDEQRWHGPPDAERSALWSALIPGLGQWRAGRRVRGLLLALPALLGIGGVVWIVLEVRRNGVAGIVEVLVQPRWLWFLVVVNALLALERVFAVADAWRGQPRAEADGATWAWRLAAVMAAF